MPDSNLATSLLAPDEAPHFMRIRHAAFVHDINKILYFNAPASKETLDRVVRDTQDLMKKNTVYYKCVDLSTTDIIAAARWTYHRPGDHTATMRTQQEVDEELKIHEPYPESHPDVWNALFRLLYENKREIMGLRPYWSLDTLVTHPEHHRRGAGALLMKKGLEQVDEAGVECYLEASPVGRPLYERWGFEPVKDIALDLRTWGGSEEITWTVSCSTVTSNFR